MKKGTISVETQNIFPIIKKFLYSDQEIFLRELISNAVDASTKIKTLNNKGVFKGELGEMPIRIELDIENKIIKIIDRGIGMTADEVEKFLNQVAFSSAAEFVEKYQSDDGIIGHFGLGFYSSFMVAKKVEVKTLSYQDGAEAVMWSCEGDPEYSIEKIDKTDRGTEIWLHISEEGEDYLSESKLLELLEKYCKFLPTEIIMGKETKTEGEGDDKKEYEVDRVINNPNPAWKKSASDLKDEDYKAFYKELYPYAPEPLFWIHLNIDFPFNLTGILYFPPLSSQFDQEKNKVHLYSNQVFVTDEVKDILPEFLSMMTGVIDSPDIPLNVSRSYLQADGNVKKIGSYISKKVAERLKDLFKKDRKMFADKWADIGPIVKYGMITDDKFFDRAKDFSLIKNTNGESFTLAEYKEKIKELQTDKNDKLVCIYTNDKDAQYSFIHQVAEYNYDVAMFDHIIDNHFLQALEQKEQDFLFVRVDSDIPSNLVQKDEEKESVLNESQIKKLEELFKNVVGESKSSKVEMKALSPNEPPVMIIKPEFMRRFQEMQMMQGGGMPGMDMDMSQIIVNTNNELINKKLLGMKSKEKKDTFISHLYSLARLNQGMLTGEDLSKFVSSSLEYLK